MKELFEYIDGSLSPFHAVKEAENRLQEKGFVHLEESEMWNLVPGEKYYVTRNGSSVIAFTVPEESIFCYHMTASHSDSPTFRIKKYKAEGKYYAKAEVEGYGGMIMSSWFDRPLTFAGRVIVRNKEGIQTKLVAPDKDIFVIPNLAIHFNREINSGYKYNPQIDLQPMYGGEDVELQSFLEEEMDSIIDSDFVLAVRQKANYLGVKDEYYMAPRIDDLACAFTTLQGFLTAKEPTNKGIVNVWCMFDNEEVGSGTRQGAMSGFLPEVLMRLEESLHLTKEESLQARSRSLLISADNAHGVHPNLPGKSDSEFPVILNQGIVIKYNASQKYTTTGMTAAVFRELCKENEIPTQSFANRADAPGGSTLGNLLSHQFSIPMLDIGLPQLAMHSAVETAGCQDAKNMIKAMKKFYESSLHQVKDGEWKL